MTQQRHPTLSAQDLQASQRGELRPGSSVRDFTGCARALAHWYLEYRAGRRAVDQLHPVLSCELRATLRAQWTKEAPALAVRPVLRCIVQHASDAVVHAVVLATAGPRVIAIAIEFRRDTTSGAWTVTELATPDDGAARERANQSSVTAIDTPQDMLRSEAA